MFLRDDLVGKSGTFLTLQGTSFPASLLYILQAYSCCPGPQIKIPALPKGLSWFCRAVLASWLSRAPEAKPSPKLLVSLADYL